MSIQRATPTIANHVAKNATKDRSALIQPVMSIVQRARPPFAVAAVPTPKPTATTAGHATKNARVVHPALLASVSVLLDKEYVMDNASTPKRTWPIVPSATIHAPLGNCVSIPSARSNVPLIHQKSAQMVVPTSKLIRSTVGNVAPNAPVAKSVSMAVVCVTQAFLSVMANVSTRSPIGHTVPGATQLVQKEKSVPTPDVRRSVQKTRQPLALMGVSTPKQTAITVADATKNVRVVHLVSRASVSVPLEKPIVAAFVKIC